MEAKKILGNLYKLETAILTVLWEELLERINKVSKKLQEPGLDLCEGLALITSLEIFIKSLREKSNEKLINYELGAKGFSSKVEENYSNAKNRIKIYKYSDGTTRTSPVQGRDKFLVEVLNRLLDTLITELTTRKDVYNELGKKFKFLTELTNKHVAHIDEDSVDSVLQC
ncbi:hypothetical protein Zmor_018345 [Zophobas morio]|uniref:Uncharacterized protein n=1 Tax=Zophobas morio TaxID=2755281 RepID=A0AA38MDG1_9CUCU|nr:hypothetical protein Zmor_018345 [Zophobas morio]